MSKIEKQAAKESKDGIRHVVYVPDEGSRVFDDEQIKMYRAFVFIESTFLGGVKIASNQA